MSALSADAAVGADLLRRVSGTNTCTTCPGLPGARPPCRTFASLTGMYESSFGGAVVILFDMGNIKICVNYIVVVILFS